MDWRFLALTMPQSKESKLLLAVEGERYEIPQIQSKESNPVIALSKVLHQLHFGLHRIYGQVGLMHFCENTHVMEAVFFCEVLAFADPRSSKFVTVNEIRRKNVDLSWDPFAREALSHAITLFEKPTFMSKKDVFGLCSTYVSQPGYTIIDDLIISPMGEFGFNVWRKAKP